MKIAVVIPCYKVKEHIERVVAGIGPSVFAIYVVDDACSEGSGDFVEQRCQDPRLKVLRHRVNRGVGGAVKTGYQAALADGADVVVKLDGDGQMDPALIPSLTQLIAAGEADYVKGNRFFSLYDVRQMPTIRLLGNALLSFMTKISSGYWSIFDPTNGLTAISSDALRRLNLDNIADRYFFETDVLINLGGIRAVVRDMPMEAVYGDEKSGLKISKILGEFLWKHVRSSIKRLVYWYFLRDFSVASVNLLFGLPLLVFGIIFGTYTWSASIASGVAASTGTVMLAVLPIILGFQMLVNFLAFDIANEPVVPLRRFYVRHSPE